MFKIYVWLDTYVLLSRQVSDQGGGIPRSLSERMFHYMYSTAPQPSKSDAHTVPLAGKYFQTIFLNKI